MRSVKYILFYACLVLIAGVFVAPYVLAIFGAFKSPTDLFGTAPWAPPHSVYLDNFQTLFNSKGFLR